MRRPGFLTIVALLFFPASLLAWGNSGHRIICQIAWERLTPGGRAIIQEAHDLERFIEDQFDGCENCPRNHPSDSRHLTLQAGCIWPDESRRDTFKGTYEYHFVNVSSAHNSFDLNRDCAGMDCAVVAVQRYATDLAIQNPTGRNREVKSLALRFLGHFVGDMHQPLHVGHIEDLGGNRIRVKWRTGNGNATTNSNLHRVWDSDIMRRGGLTRQAQGVDLNNEITSAEASSWENFDIADWAAESYQHAQNSAYQDTSGNDVQNGDTLGTAYFNRGFPIVKERLKQAGVRLAFLINSIADGALPTSMVRLSAP